MSAVTVALATEAEAPACLALLPAMRNAAAEWLVARLDGGFAGAAAVVWRNRRDAAGFPMVVEVLPERRRAGAGAALVAAAKALIQGEAEGLWSHGALDEASEAAAFARACGFEPRRREHHFLAEVGRVHDYVSPLVGRLRARGRIPDGVSIVPLKEAPQAEAAWLISAEFGGGPGGTVALLRGGGPLDLERSLAIMEGDQLAAVVFGRWIDDCPVVEGSVVAPAWRGGWANAVMVEAIAAVGLRGGAKHVRFHCEEDVLDTMRLAQKAEAVLERTAALYYAAAASS